jgi:hypothetical protein
MALFTQLQLLFVVAGLESEFLEEVASIVASGGGGSR